MKVLPVLAMAVVLATSAAAQDGGHLNVKTTVQKEEITVNADGTTERRLLAADTVVPGDDVVYTIVFTNVSVEPADNVVITNPIADTLTYVDGSAFGAGTVIEFSADGGRTFGAAGTLTVDSNGSPRPARAEDFTHVRWTMQNDLEPGTQGMALFRARLN